jgi:bacteriophage exclusion system BrxC/D-like protein
VLRLANLTPEDLYVLLGKLRHVFAGGEPDGYLVPDEALEAYMRHCASRIGDAYFRTPRNTIKGFLDLLAVLEQNPGQNWRQLISTVSLVTETDPQLAPLADGARSRDARSDDPEPGDPRPDDSGTSDDDDLSSFRL